MASDAACTGEKARDFFVKSNLSNDQLLQIWFAALQVSGRPSDSNSLAIGISLTPKIVVLWTPLTLLLQCILFKD
jgi:hypothetical protein